MSHRFDATLKDIVAEYLADFAAAFGLVGSEPLSVLNVDLSTISAATDIVFKRGDPVREIVDVNFQSSADRLLPNRLHLYSSLLNYRYDVPVRTILVLLREQSDSSKLTGKFVYTTDAEGVEFQEFPLTSVTAMGDEPLEVVSLRRFDSLIRLLQPSNQLWRGCSRLREVAWRHA